jgi:putative CocE/NonD family hydrolase
MDNFFENPIPIYAYSGWYDGGLQNGAVKLFLNNNHPDDKLLLGPWNHAAENFYKNNGTDKSYFHHTGEIMKFFDYHLKGKKELLKDDAKVHYFTLIENKWKSSSTWPPKEVENKSLYFSDNHKMTWETGDFTTTMHVMDTTATVDRYSRWYFDFHKKTDKIPSVGDRNGKAVLHISDVLNEDLEITGHAELKLYAEANNEELNLFVYLEDVHPDGNVYPIADGLLRTIHKKVIPNENAPYKYLPFYRSFLKDDAEKFKSNEVAEIRIPLAPVSYLVKKGHQIRVSITASDTLNYRNLDYPADRIRIFKDQEYPSQIILPVIESKK